MHAPGTKFRVDVNGDPHIIRIIGSDSTRQVYRVEDEDVNFIMDVGAAEIQNGAINRPDIPAKKKRNPGPRTVWQRILDNDLFDEDPS